MSFFLLKESVAKPSVLGTILQRMSITQRNILHHALGASKGGIFVTGIATHAIVDYALRLGNAVAPERLCFDREIANDAALGAEEC